MFPERIRNLRRNAGLKQSELGEIIGVTGQAVSRWENGDTQPDNESLVTLANYFNVSTDYLLGKVNQSTNDLESNNSEIDNILFSKAKDLSEEDKKAIIGVINAIKKDVDKELGE